MLKRSGDRKVSPSIRQSAKSFTVKSKNSFGLPSGVAFSCPGATSVCETICYAGKIEKMYTNVRGLLMHNWSLVSNADYAGLVTLLGDMLYEFQQECTKLDCPPIFRIHWDGDFFSIEYAEAWAEVIRANPNVKFWVYTRSFVPALNVIPFIANIPNLAVYLSVDSANRQYADAMLAEYPTLLVASLAQTASEAKAGFEQITSCPENTKRIPLVMTTNKGTMGACAACGLCVDGRRNVAFAISGKE